MGDTFAEIEAGMQMFMKWAPQLLSLFSFVKSKGVPPAQAAQMVSDHLTPGKPNIEDAGEEK